MNLNSKAKLSFWARRQIAVSASFNSATVRHISSGSQDPCHDTSKENVGRSSPSLDSLYWAAILPSQSSSCLCKNSRPWNYLPWNEKSTLDFTYRASRIQNLRNSVNYKRFASSAHRIDPINDCCRITPTKNRTTFIECFLVSVHTNRVPNTAACSSSLGIVMDCIIGPHLDLADINVTPISPLGEAPMN